jgi:hypothetical protein
VAYTLLLVYNEERVSGGCWDAYYGYDSNTNSIGYQLRTNSTTMPTLDKFYRYRLLFTAADRQHLVPANASSSTSADTAKTVTQRPIDPFGAIYYYGHTTAINANANPTASYFWAQYNFVLGYSFNRTGAALTLINHAPVYIKCAPQSDGSAIIDADNPFVQTLPSTADGKIYIFLGIASSATAVELVPEHPVFCYRNGQIRLWTGNEERELPDFTTEDDGKVLSIVDGSWGLAYCATEEWVGQQGFAYDMDLDERTSAFQILLKLVGTTLVYDGSVQQLYSGLAHLANIWFLLPLAYLTGQSDNQAIRFTSTYVDSDTTVPKLMLTSLYGGNIYSATLVPVSENRLEGALSVSPVVPAGGSTGDFLRRTASGVAWETIQTYQGGSY